MAATAKPLDEMFLDTLKDVYYAEKQILKALPKMAKAAKSPELKQAFETHRSETEEHVERLGQVFEIVGKAPRGKTCVGILEEGKAVMEDYADSPALDAGLVASAQAVEHYEMARYGTLKAWAAQLGLKDAVKLLDATLAEEIKTDKALTQLGGPANSAAVAKAA